VPPLFSLGHQLGSLLSSHLDGELAASAARIVEAHLGDCPSCRAELAALWRVKRALGALRSPPPSNSRRAALLVRFRERHGIALA
jgi:anti-sigma factor RsiW